MPEDKMQQQRFELKYRIDENMALAVRDFVSGYLECDPNGVGKPNLSYPVHSVYLDSDDLYLRHTTLNGDKNRFKLRVRFYDDDLEAPVWFEIKRRIDQVIAKQRGGVRRNAVAQILAGQPPCAEQMADEHPRSLAAVREFSRLMNRLAAKPKAHVAYLREAWINPDNNTVRVTLDRAVLCEPKSEAKVATQMDDPFNVFGHEVILELKFTDRFPDWFRDMTRVFHLTPCGAAKYADGVTLSGLEKFASLPFQVPPDRNLDDLFPSAIGEQYLAHP